jgi:hypothetical protein
MPWIDQQRACMGGLHAFQPPSSDPLEVMLPERNVNRQGCKVEEVHRRPDLV